MAKKKQAAGAGAPAERRVALVAHPRARASIRRWRGRAGLIGLIGVALLSLRAGVPPFDAVLRGLVGGIAAQFVAWAAAVLAWRHLVVAELALHREAHALAAAKRRVADELRAADAIAAKAAKAARV